MGQRSTGSRGDGNERNPPLVQVPPDLRDDGRDDDVEERKPPKHPFERPEVADQGSPGGRGTVDDPDQTEGAEDPADPTSPIHPEG